MPRQSTTSQTGRKPRSPGSTRTDSPLPASAGDPTNADLSSLAHPEAATTLGTPLNRFASEIHEPLLNQIARGAALCREVERQLGENPGPELETIIKLHRMMILNLSAQAQQEPDLLRHVHALTKSVIDWAQLEEKRKARELAEQKYRDELEARE